MARRGHEHCGESAVLTVFRVAETGSTNADMLAMAARGETKEGDWLVAAHQTAGRGRQGRAWLSPPGNLYASGLVELRTDDPPAPTLALVAGVAAIDALGVSELRLKWPNDILAGTEKLGGILLERHGDAIVVGVGLNLDHAPALSDRPATSLAALGYDLSADAAVDLLAWHFMNHLARWRRLGVPATCAGWMERAHPLDTAISAASPDGTRIEGRFGGLNDEGALILRLADGSTRVIHAGDVFLI